MTANNHFDAIKKILEENLNIDTQFSIKFKEDKIKGLNAGHAYLCYSGHDQIGGYEDTRFNFKTNFVIYYRTANNDPGSMIGEVQTILDTITAHNEFSISNVAHIIEVSGANLYDNDDIEFIFEINLSVL